MPKAGWTEVVEAAVSVVNPLELEGLVVLAGSPKLKPLIKKVHIRGGPLNKFKEQHET